MSEPVPSETPRGPAALQPIADAFRAAEAAAAAEAEAVAQAEAEAAQLAEDASSIKCAFKRGGSKMAIAVGRALGWRKDEVEDLFREKPRARRGSSHASAEGDGGEAADAGGTADDPASPPGDPRDDTEGGERLWKPKRRPIKPLPDECPVVPLGKIGGTYHYLDPDGEHVGLTKHGAEELRKLFGKRLDFLWSFQPKYRADGEQSGWKADMASESLIDACGRRGIFDPGRRLRGVGAWPGDDGSLVLHCGDAVWIGGEWRPPGYHGEHVYPGADRVPRPAEETADGSAARTLLRLFDTWSWEDATGDSDIAAPRLQISAGADAIDCTVSAFALLAWQCSALVGGALDWRPMCWITGDQGSGKSTLQKVVGRVMGASLVQASDATSAGVHQAVGYSSRAAAIDEGENDPASAKMKNMIELVRQSASGGLVLRGSNDGKHKGYTARSSFLLSSIIVPPLRSQDVSRIDVLRLGALRSTTPPAIDAAQLAAIGRQLRRRIMDGWSRWPATLERYRAELAVRGHDARSCDQVGTLIAMADLALWNGEPDSDTAAELADVVGFGRAHARAETGSDADAMVQFLVTCPLDVFRGGTRITIGSLVAGAAHIEEVGGGTADTCRNALAAVGLYVQGERDRATVTLPNNHTGLAKLFEATHWRSMPGASSGWAQAVRRLHGAQATNSRRLGGRGWSVPVRIFVDPEPPPRNTAEARG